MDLLELIKSFGLPIGLLLAVVLGLVRSIQTVLEGKLVVPRWAYDAEVAHRLKVEEQLERALSLLEREHIKITEPAVRKLVGGAGGRHERDA